jgi:hypothetical protein
VPRRGFFFRDRSPGDEQRAAVPTERATGIEEHVVAGAVGVRVITELGDVGLSRERRLVQCFDVGETL